MRAREAPISARIAFCFRVPLRPRNSAMNSRTRSVLPEMPVTRDMRRQITLQPRLGVPMRTGRIAGAPFHPVGVGRLDIDEIGAVPRAAQRQVRIEPNVILGERLEPLLGVIQHRAIAIRALRPPDRDPRADGDRRRRGRVGDAGFVGDVVDREDVSCARFPSSR